MVLYRCPDCKKQILGKDEGAYIDSQKYPVKDGTFQCPGCPKKLEVTSSPDGQHWIPGNWTRPKPIVEG